MKKNIAIVGCGGIGRAHAAAYAQIEDCKVVAFVDTNLKNAELFAHEFGGLALRSVEDLPAEVMAASVTTPPSIHYIIANRLLEKNISVFCEKPLTMDTKESESLINSADKKKLVLMVGFKMRFEPIFIRAKEMLNEIGNLVGISATKLQPYNPGNHNHWVTNTGAMYELSVHDFDLITWLTGLEPKKVYAVLRHRMQWLKEDTFSLLTVYENEVLVNYFGMYAREAQFFFRDITMTFLGEKGYMRIERPDNIVLHTGAYKNEKIPDVKVNSFVEELKHFCRVLEGKEKNKLSGYYGLLTTKLIESANKSFKTGEMVEIAACG